MPKSSSDDTAVVIGVVSWGISCGTPNANKGPGVYTRVTSYLKFIKYYMQN